MKKTLHLPLQPRRKFYNLTRSFLLLIVLLIATVAANATTWTAVVSGNWTTNATWGVASNPGTGNSGDTYIIPSGITVTVTTTISAYGIININGGTLVFSGSGSLNTVNSNGNGSGTNPSVGSTLTGTALTTYNIVMTANGATLNTGGIATIEPYNLTINTVNTTDVVNITGTTSSAPLLFGNNANIVGTLTFVKGLLNANGQFLTAQKAFIITGSANGNFATSIDGTCLHPDADGGTFTENGSSGSAESVVQGGNVNFYNLTVANNMTFTTGGDVTVLGTYTAQRTGNAGNPTVSGGVFTWGPNSLYVTTTGSSSTYTPKGEYASPITAAGPAKTGTAPGTANSLYVTPTAIQTAITACATPTITEANNSGGQQAAANITANGATNYPIANFQVAVSSSSATLNKVAFTTIGTATASDITNFQLWYNSTNSFSGATSVGNISGAGAGTQTFSGLSQSIAIGATGFFWITAQIPSVATAGRTITVGATPALTFALGTATGTTSAAGTQTIQAVIPPTITLASTSTVGAANLSTGSTNNVVFNFNTAVTTSAASLNTVSFTTTGSATAADITNFQLWYNSTNSFAGAISIKTISGAGAGTQTFSGLSQAIASGATGYFWITANITSGAAVTDNFAVSAITPSNLTFALGTPSGSTTAGGTQTIFATNPTVVTGVALGITTTTAALNGTVNANNISGVTTAFDYGTSISYGTSATGSPSSVTGISATAVSSALTGLASNTIYHFRINGIISGIPTHGTDATFTTLPVAPAAAAATAVSASGFTANWVASGGSASLTYTLQYSTDPSFLSGVTIVSGITGTSSIINGLTASTIYYYRVDAINVTGNSAWSSNGSATTSSVPPTPVTGVATSVTASAAILNGTVNANGSAGVTTTFDYGTSTSYGTNVAGSPGSVTGTGGTPVSYTVTAGLVPNTIYHFRINGVISGTSIHGADASFTTISNAPIVGAGTTPTVNGFTANWSAPATQGSATYTYTVDVSADNTFATGVTTQAGISSGTLSYTFTTLSSSTSGITYYYRVKTVNAGGTAVSATSAGIATLPYPYSWYNGNYVAGPFYIKNDYTGFGFQYLYDTLSVANNYTGTEDGNNGSDASSYSNYGRVVRNVNATESSIPYLNNQSYMWVIEKDPITGYYEIKNIATGRYFHTGAYGDYYAQDLDNNSLNVYAYNNTLVNGATGANNSSQANIELSYYCYTLPSGASSTSFTSQIIDQRFAWGQRQLHGELSSTHANAPRPTMVFFTSNNYAWGTKTWDFNIASLTPSIVATVATNIATTSTTIGGNVTYAGSSGATVTTTGFKYSTVSTFDPTTAGTNVMIGAGLGAFSANLTSLSASTKYYYYAYATNSTGTAYSQKDSVFTLSALPTTQPTTFTSNCPQITLSWPAIAGLPTSAQAPRIGYIILRTTGGAAPSLTSGVNRYAPYSALFTANLPAGVTIIDSISYLNASLPTGTLTFRDTVSTAGTYNYELVPYTYDGIPSDSTYNYFITGAKLVNSVAVIKGATWLGKNTNWNDSTNWCNGSVPTATTNVVIPAGLSLYPYLGTAGSSNNGYADSLSLGFGASFTVGTGGSLSISGNITNTGGIFNAIAGTIVMSGNSAQTIAGSSFINQTVYSLMDSTTSGGLSIDSLNIIGELGFPYAGTSSLTISKNVVLISNALTTAWVGPIAESGGVAKATITGNVIVQRYFPAHRRWRLITAPVTAASAQTINAAWQEGVVSTTTPVLANPDPLPGFGTHITGPSHTTYAPGLGYDQSPSNSASIAYVADTAAWYALPNTNVTKVTDYQGYMLFVRGSRNYSISTTAQATPATAATLRTTGSLKTGLQGIPVAVGPNVIGNPYATTINFNTIYTRNTAVLGTNAFYLWSPDIASASNVASGTGGWVVLITDGAGGYIAVPNPINSFNTNGDIQSGAAFMVHAQTSGTVNINEADKVSPAATNNDLYLFRPTTPTTPFASLRTTLYGTAADTVNYLADGVLNMFDNSFSNDVNWNKDIQKQANLNEQCAIIKNGRLISVQKSLPVNAGDTIYLQMARLGQKSYRFALQASNFNRPDLTAYLIDTFAHTNTPVSLNDNAITDVDFTITNAAGTGAGRFALAFRAAPGSATYTSITAVQQNKNALVQWTVSTQLNVKEYIVYKSTDGTNFYPVDTTIATAGTTGNFVYNWVDVNPIKGTNYYKVRNINNDGTFQESNIAKLDISKDPVISGIGIYPDPVVNGVVGLQMNNVPLGNYNISVINAAGQVILVQTINHETATETRNIILNKGVAKGLYILDIQSPDIKTKIKFVNQ